MADRIRGTNQPHETQLRLEPHRTHRHQRSPNLVRTWRLRPQPCQNRHPRSVKRPPTLLTAPHQQFRLRAPPQSRVFQVEVANSGGASGGLYLAQPSYPGDTTRPLAPPVTTAQCSSRPILLDSESAAATAWTSLGGRWRA